MSQTARLFPSSTDRLTAIAPHAEAAIAWRHDFHRHPELAFEEHRTSAKIADLLDEWGYEVSTGIGDTGVVGHLQRGTGTRRLGLRADIDALPITEDASLAVSSQTRGLMHACGHDGHTAILLAAARYLAKRGQFDGHLQLIFQPAEETGSGAQRMLEDGLFQRFPVDAVFGLHNWPGLAAGQLGFVTGPAMASVDWLKLTVQGQGGHGAEPQGGIDPILTAAHIVCALQSIVSRNVDPREMAVVTVGAIHGGAAANVIPDQAELKLTARAFLPEVREQLRQRIPALAEAVAAGFGASVVCEFKAGFPSVINHPRETAFARQVALDLYGRAGLAENFAPRTASEDFSFFLREKPGSFLFLGNGPGEPLHSPRYVFNDAIIAPAAAYWVQLAETFLSTELIFQADAASI